MKTLTKTFEEILDQITIDDGSDKLGSEIILDLINAVSEYNKQVVGEDVREPEGMSVAKICNKVREEVRQRQEGLL